MISRTRAVSQGFFVVFLWATSWVLIKIGLQDIAPLTFAGLRYTLAFLCLLPVSFFNVRDQQPGWRKRLPWGKLILLGLLFYTGTQGASFVALSYLLAVTVNLMWSFTSVMVALSGIIWLSERPPRFQWWGIVIAAAGALLYFTPVSLPRHGMPGLIVGVCGIFANALSSLLGREVNRPALVSPLLITVVSMGIGGCTLLGVGVFVEGAPVVGWRGWLIILWLAVVNTAFAFTLWNHTLRTLTAVESSIINGTMLIWIPIFAVLFLGETVTGKEVIGLVIAGAGTLIVRLRRPWNVLALFKGE